MEIYTVKVAVKPYTKAYLENNYGNPADIRQDPELNDMVTMMLREGSTRLDKIISSNFPATVELRITKDTFFRYGDVYKRQQLGNAVTPPVMELLLERGVETFY